MVFAHGTQDTLGDPLTLANTWGNILESQPGGCEAHMALKKTQTNGDAIAHQFKLRSWGADATTNGSSNTTSPDVASVAGTHQHDCQWRPWLAPFYPLPPPLLSPPPLPPLFSSLPLSRLPPIHTLVAAIV